jgi:hypothetical protein
MKITINAVIFSAISFIGIHSAVASELSYTCKVVHVYELDDDGSLKPSSLEKQFIDGEFSVSRVTGEIVGAVIPTLVANSTKVINKGNKEYSFKSIAEFDAVNKPLSSGDENSQDTASIQLLEVQEFKKGLKKPFVSLSMGGAGIVTGICK